MLFLARVARTTHVVLWSQFAHGSGAVGCCTLIHGSTSLRGWSISRMKPCKHDRDRAQRNTRWQQPNNVSTSYPQETVQPAWTQESSTNALLANRSRSLGQTAEWTTCQIKFKAFACAAHPKIKEVFDFATRKGTEAVVIVK